MFGEKENFQCSKCKSFKKLNPKSLSFLKDVKCCNRRMRKLNDSQYKKEVEQRKRIGDYNA